MEGMRYQSWEDAAMRRSYLLTYAGAGTACVPSFSPQPAPEFVALHVLSLTRSSEEMQEAGVPLPHPLLATLCRLTARLPRHRRRHARRGGGAA